MFYYGLLTKGNLFSVWISNYVYDSAVLTSDNLGNKTQTENVRNIFVNLMIFAVCCIQLDTIWSNWTPAHLITLHKCYWYLIWLPWYYVYSRNNYVAKFSVKKLMLHSPRNEHLNLLFQITFLNIFLYSSK